jgi:hypothetical protein
VCGFVEPFERWQDQELRDADEKNSRGQQKEAAGTHSLSLIAHAVIFAQTTTANDQWNRSRAHPAILNAA